MRLTKVFLFFAYVTFAGMGYAQVVECTYPDGSKVYTQKCADGAVKIRPVHVGSTPASNPSTMTNDQLEAAFRARQIEKEETERKEAADKLAAQHKLENCIKAKDELGKLDSGKRIKMVPSTTSGADPFYLDENQKAQEIQKREIIVQKNCE